VHVPDLDPLARGVARATTTPTGIPASSFAFTFADGSLSVMSPPCGLTTPATRP
jgi:hypothetical protein